jgi:hypothetical protein
MPGASLSDDFTRSSNLPFGKHGALSAPRPVAREQRGRSLEAVTHFRIKVLVIFHICCGASSGPGDCPNGWDLSQSLGAKAPSRLVSRRSDEQSRELDLIPG